MLLAKDDIQKIFVKIGKFKIDAMRLTSITKNVNWDIKLSIARIIGEDCIWKL